MTVLHGLVGALGHAWMASSKLRENDETFRSLLLQVRRGLAERYIGNEDYSVTEIAFLLGYNDTSAFSRAFRNWFGRSPTQVREENKAA